MSRQDHSDDVFRQLFSLDYRSLALLRVTLASIILIDLVFRSQWLSAHYTDSGILPLHALDLSNYAYAWYFQILTLNGESWFVTLFFIVNAVFAVCLLFGYQTRLMTFLCWLLLCSLHLRNGLILNSGDSLLRAVLFWSMFLPLGARFSIDSIFYSSSPTPSLSSSPTTFNKKYEFSAATIALYAQAILLYFFAGILKIKHMSWLDGSHVYNSFSRDEFLQPLGVMMYPYYDLLTAFTYFTLFIELFGPVLFFIPFAFGPVRTATVLLFTFFQAGLLLTMYVGLFPLISIAATIALLPEWFWNKISVIKIKLTARSDWRMQSVSNSAMKKTASYLPYFPLTAGRTGLPVWQNYLITTILLYVIIWNMEGAIRSFTLPDAFKAPGYHLALNQKWGMFSAPATNAGWFIVSAQTRDGTEFDLLNGNNPVSWDKPERISRQFGYARWRKYISDNLRLDRNEQHRANYLRYLQQNWNSNNNEKDHISNLKLIHMRYAIGSQYDHSDPAPVVLYEYDDKH